MNDQYVVPVDVENSEYTELISKVLMHTNVQLQGSSPEDVYLEMDELLQFSVELGKAAKVIQYRALYWFRENWDNISLDFRNKYNNQFYIYACRKTGKKWGTVQNYLNTIETFYINKKSPLGKVKIPKRDKYGNTYKDQNNDPVMVSVEWDETVPNLSKLVTLRSAAETGNMTDTLWSLAMDSRATVEDVKGVLYTNNSTSLTEKTYYIEGPLLLVSQYGEVHTVAEFNFEEYDKNPVIKESIDNILKFLRVIMDEESITRILDRKEVGQLYANNSDR